jgi:4-hydroxythreonine-4-phosphate dehydrogenase
MKVYVTQGHEHGVGLEVFFKSCLLLTESELKKVKLLAFKGSVQATLSSLHLPWSWDESSLTIAHTKIQTEWLSKTKVSESYSSLLRGMELCERSDAILFTLPTSKNQFPGIPGHTEFFRAHYKKDDLAMFFSSPSLQVLLLSDHVPIKNLSELMTENLIFERLDTAFTSLKKWGWPIRKVLISGFNPHAGERGLIGHEDSRITAAIKRLRGTSNLDMSGPLPADTMLLEKRSKNDLLVYVFHDQGLGGFKGVQGFIGSNITLGLPYLRFSPDHGTSFSLYGLNAADYRGCSFALRQAMSMLKKVTKNGKNSSHKSKGS